MMAVYSIYIDASQHMTSTEDNTIDLVVMSPPYPMIEMWDEIMAKQNPEITDNLESNPEMTFELMCRESGKVWKECFRVLKIDGFLCVNIGDATRTVNDSFTLCNSHSRISKACIEIGFVGLPNIVQREQTNIPNKFMDSGMLPCGAYVTLEHEQTLVFRKGSKHEYKKADAKLNRMKSSSFQEERNVWLSNVREVKGTKQKIQRKTSRERNAAHPFEAPYRLINIFLQKGDTVMDPFLETGTTTQAAMLLRRNSCGYEINPGFETIIRESIDSLKLDSCNNLIKQHFDAYKEFIVSRRTSDRDIKHYNNKSNYEVMTSQEKKTELNYLESILLDQETGKYVVTYEDHSDLNKLPFKNTFFKVARQYDEYNAFIYKRWQS